jgi:hypothetical protein
MIFIKFYQKLRKIKRFLSRNSSSTEYFFYSNSGIVIDIHVFALGTLWQIRKLNIIFECYEVPIDTYPIYPQILMTYKIYKIIIFPCSKYPERHSQHCHIFIF